MINRTVSRAQDRTEIFARHCTPKKRVHTTAGSLGDDPEYDPTRERVDDALRESASRVVVHTTKTSSFGSSTAFRRRYVMIRRAGTWLVDNLQCPHPMTGNWTRRPL